MTLRSIRLRDAMGAGGSGSAGEGSGAGEEEWKSRGPEAGVWGEAGGLGIPPGALGDHDPRRDWRAAVGRKERFRSVGAAFLFACWVRPFRHQLSGVSVTLLPCSVFTTSWGK